MLLLSFVALFGFMSFSNGDLQVTDNELPPKTIRACWVIFGSEVICLTVEQEGIQLPDGLKIPVEFASSGDYMNFIFPRGVRSGTLTVSETLNFDLCGSKKTIQKGTKINVRNGVGKISFK